jgi:hypothetical protein
LSAHSFSNSLDAPLGSSLRSDLGDREAPQTYGSKSDFGEQTQTPAKEYHTISRTAEMKAQSRLRQFAPMFLSSADHNSTRSALLI